MYLKRYPIELPIEDELFTRPEQYPIIACNRSKHSVRPNQVISHLKGAQHRLSMADATQVQQAIHQWDRVKEAETFIISSRIRRSIPRIPVHHDGILCTRESNCGYVCRKMNSITSHWRSEHSWAPHQRRGHPRGPDQAKAEQNMTQYSRKVSCQQVFPRGLGSHYIHVQRVRQPVEVDHPSHQRMLRTDYGSRSKRSTSGAAGCQTM